MVYTGATGVISVTCLIALWIKKGFVLSYVCSMQGISLKNIEDCYLKYGVANNAAST